MACPECTAARETSGESAGCTPGPTAVPGFTATLELLWHIHAAPGGKRKAQITFGSQHYNRTFLCSVSIPLGGNVELLYTSENGVRVEAMLETCTAVPGNLFIFLWYGGRWLCSLCLRILKSQIFISCDALLSGTVLAASEWGRDTGEQTTTIEAHL